MWWELKHKQQKVPNARANINVFSSTRFSGLIFEDEMICTPRTARYVVRNQAETAEDVESTGEHQRIQQYAIFRFNFWRRNNMIPRTARYVMGIKAQTAEDATNTSEHERIQQYVIFQFNFWRQNEMHTTNCKVCGTKSSRNSRRCRKHERTSTYTAVRDFPV